MLQDLRAVIFDLDGLVLDSESSYFVAWRIAAAEMGYRLDDDFCASLTGLHGAEVYRRLRDFCGDAFDLEHFNRLSRERWLTHIQQQPIAVKAGFHQLVDCLANLRIPYALATNSRRQDALFCLENAGLAEFFPLIFCRDDVEQGKPAPDLIFKAAQRLAVSVEQCLVLEDSPIGVMAAKRAGANCILIPSMPMQTGTAVADLVMDDLSQVADFVTANFSPSL